MDHYAHRRVSIKVNFLPSTDFSFLLHLIFFLSQELNWFSSCELYQVKQRWDRESTTGKGEAAERGTGPLRDPSCPVLSAPLPPAPVSSTWGAQPSPGLGQAFASLHPRAACGRWRNPWPSSPCFQALGWGPGLPLAQAPCSVSSSICSSGGCTSASTSPQTGRPQPGWSGHLPVEDRKRESVSRGWAGVLGILLLGKV